ncbi:uncharacterized protein LOC133839155 [Drosophila sulfurigaster albostrigata]|uniref:uncharacterized protein LOC133839155 n=1 Tax=Drosophila sulfurigaster albostrigata TaxID=89887 RepID=UPI002D21A49F|nr:uncharacterized protein LOC133839155 [Drosophila sulfurigaster albostrigata]
MRGFIVLSLLAAVANADVGGYNYGAGIGSSSSGGSLTSGSLSGGSLSSNQLSGGSVSGGLLLGDSSTGSSVDFANNNQQQQPEYANAEFNKEFFTYSAPEADFEDNRSVGDLAASLKRNLRVLFIRAPENKGLENAALSLAKQAAEQQTAIYVLTKQGDLSSLANKLQNLNHVSAKRPEVHFVKYRTPEDAINAQRTIQQEYDRLGGSSISHNGGVAPVLDFASKQLVQQQQPLLIDERRSGGISVDSIGNGNGGSVVSELEAPAAYVAPAATSPGATYLPVNKAK